jgi:hypothetical protein
MPELFGQDEPQIRHFSVESPVEKKERVDVKRFITGEDWQKIFTFVKEAQVDYPIDDGPSGCFYGAIKLLDPVKFKDLPIEFDHEDYNNFVKALGKGNLGRIALKGEPGYERDDRLLNDLLREHINLKILFPDRSNFHNRLEPSWRAGLASFIKRYTQQPPDAPRALAFLTLFSDKLAPDPVYKMEIADFFWDTVERGLVAELQNPDDYQGLSFSIKYNNLLWEIATMRLYEPGRFNQSIKDLIDTLLEYSQRGLDDFRGEEKWNEFCTIVMLLKIITAHSVKIGLNGLEIVSDEPTQESANATGLPPRRQF